MLQIKTALLLLKSDQCHCDIVRVERSQHIPGIAALMADFGEKFQNMLSPQSSDVSMENRELMSETMSEYVGVFFSSVATDI